MIYRSDKIIQTHNKISTLLKSLNLHDKCILTFRIVKNTLVYRIYVDKKEDSVIAENDHYFTLVIEGERISVQFGIHDHQCGINDTESIGDFMFNAQCMTVFKKALMVHLTYDTDDNIVLLEKIDKTYKLEYDKISKEVAF